MPDPRSQMTPRDDQRGREHVLTTNGMGYFWCSCSNTAHVLWSLNDHLAEIAAETHAAGKAEGRAETAERIAVAIEALPGGHGRKVSTRSRPSSGTGT